MAGNVEETETTYRTQLLREIDLPGPNPHARFHAVLKKSLSLWQEIPLLRFFAGGDYDLLLRRILRTGCKPISPAAVCSLSN